MGEGPHILLVEDDRALGEVLEEALLEDGYSVTREANRHDAVRRATMRVPQLIVSDWAVAGMSMDDFRAALTAAGIACPILICSGLPAARTWAMENGAKYLAKPFDLDSLSRAVLDALPSARDLSGGNHVSDL